MSEKTFRSGFVSIVGKPNVGKSTLMNILVGENLSIITSKAQTTRHRIRGILTGEDYQIIYSDTPGVINPVYKLHESMMHVVHESLEDADLVLFITDIFEEYDEQIVIDRLNKLNVPILLIINKVDLVKDQQQVVDKIAQWESKLKVAKILAISALTKFNTERVFEELLALLPVHPAYFPADELTDRSERFFASEIIREKIFMNYKKEVPYSTEVIINEFKETDDLLRIQADILVERATQRSIIIGHQGSALKKVGTEARKDLETFFGKKVFLQTYVKVEPDWRSKDAKLKNLGYIQD